MKGVGRTIFTEAERVHLLAFSKSFLLIFIVFVHIIFPSASQNVTVEPFYYNYSECYSLNNNRPIENMTQLDLNVAFFTGVSSGQGKWYGGAFFLAIETLNNIAKECNLPVQFNWTFRDAGNRESFAMKEIVDLYCAQNISAFIGPDVHCKTMGLLATGLNIPYITYNCQETHNETGEQLLINTETSFVYISRFIASVLHHYKWTSFWLVTGKEPRWQSAAKQLKASAFVMNITINGETVDDSNDLFSSYVYRSHKYRKVLTDSKDHTRVYVFLGVFESLLLFLREMANLGMTSTGKYAVIAADDSKGSTLNETFYLTTFEIGKHFVNLTETEKRDKLSAFKNVLVVRPAKGDVHIQKFEDAVYSKNIMPPIKLIETPKWLNSKPNIPIQAYQLFDAVMFYGKAVMALMNTQDADPTNATQIINYLRRRSHNSIQGETIWIHGNGESQGTYKVESLVTGQDGNIERRLVEVGSFTSNNGIDQIYVQKRKAFWVSGTPPVSNPNCGFDETCSKLHGWKIAIIVIGVFLFVLFVVIILILGLRHYMYEQKLERLAWKIEREDIQILNDGQFKDLTTPFRPRKKDSYSGNQLRTFLMALDSDPDITDGSCSSDGIPVGVYKGTDVAVRKLTRKNLELTRALKKQLQLRKELTHENINRFIGACIDIPYVYLVTQYCTRASLQDILRNEVSPLDDMFSTSLVQDLIRGMSFIHDSEIGYHGNLKSSNCLVDSRWTLKISDFALSALGCPDSTTFDDDESCRALLWTAPELLRVRRRCSTSSSHPHHLNPDSLYNNNNNIKNTNYKQNKDLIIGHQKGDVYSFSIVLFELYGKCGPWGNTKLTNGQIIDCLMSRTTPVLRPDTSSLTCDANIINIICACWDDDPDLRPDFKYGIRNRFKPFQQDFLKSNIFDNMLAMMEKHANNLEVMVAERTEQLRLEKRMTENLLLRMLPRSVAEKLKRGQRVEAEQFEQVSIYFSDIVGFTELSAESTPMEIVDLLNDLYTCFDSIIEEFDVYKVETIGDAYMVVSGLPIFNGDRHAGEIASMSLLLLEAIKKKQFRILGNTNNMLKIRIGIHSGSCCAGVVGLKMPRYCLFGDTVNTASRLESTGEALKIHCSAECKNILDKLGGYVLEERGYIEMKGKGTLLTYFLKSEDQNQRYRRIYSYKKMGSDGRCVSSSNLDYSGKIYSINGKSVTSANLSNGSKYPALPKDSPAVHRNSIPSLNTTIDDSTVSEFPDEILQHLSNINHATSSLPPLDFVSSTLPRASNQKYNSPQMSPIAEDPNSIGEHNSFGEHNGFGDLSGFTDSTLEKTVSFPNSSLCEYSNSESDALLGCGVGYILQPRNHPCGRTHSSCSALTRPSKTALWRMESFDEDTHVEECEEKM